MIPHRLGALDGKPAETLLDHRRDLIAADPIHEGVVDLKSGWGIAAAQARDSAKRKLLALLFAELVLDLVAKLRGPVQVATEVIAEGDFCSLGDLGQKMRIVRRDRVDISQCNAAPKGHSVHFIGRDVAETLLHLAQLVVDAV